MSTAKERRPASCPTGKVIHRTKESAKDHAALLRLQKGDHARPYHCPDCGFYHVGRRPKKAR
jgi:predicted RNA-binding Zn-ribbon protein involved in translation (DUF1610 family)